MAYFVQNTILTKHGLNRLDEYMYEYTETRDEAGALTSAPKELPPFNFSEVVISNVVGPLDINTTQLANEIYTVPVESVVQNGNILTIHCQLTEDITGLSLIQVGVYEAIEGEMHLFAFGNINSYKPETDYDLIINLDLNIENVQMYKDKLNLEVVIPEAVPISAGDKALNAFADVYDILQHTIKRNHDVFGAEPIQIAFDKEEKRHCVEKEVLDMLQYASSLQIATPTDVFHICTSDRLKYNLNNLVRDDSFITIENNIMTSTNDTCYFTNTGTLMLTGNFSGMSGIILNKVNRDDKTQFNFKFEVKDNTMLFTLKGKTGSLNFTAPVYNWSHLGTSNFVHTFTLGPNGVKYYINEEEIPGEMKLFNFTAAESADNMTLTNTLSNTSVYNKLQKVSSIWFYRECLDSERVKELVKAHNYLF